MFVATCFSFNARLDYEKTRGISGGGGRSEGETRVTRSPVARCRFGRSCLCSSGAGTFWHGVAFQAPSVDLRYNTVQYSTWFWPSGMYSNISTRPHAGQVHVMTPLDKRRKSLPYHTPAMRMHRCPCVRRLPCARRAVVILCMPSQ